MWTAKLESKLNTATTCSNLWNLQRNTGAMCQILIVQEIYNFIFMSNLSVLNVGSTYTDIHIWRLYVPLGLLAYCRKWLFLQTRIKLCNPVGKEHYIWEAGCLYGTLLCVTVCYFHFRYKARHLSMYPLWTVKHYRTPNDSRDLKFKSSTELIWLICCAFALLNSWVKHFFCWKGKYK